MNWIAPLFIAIVLAAVAFLRRGRGWRITWSSVAAAVTAYGLAQLAMTWLHGEVRDVATPADFVSSDAGGWSRLAPNRVTRLQRFQGNRELFDVRATSTADGLRITPRAGKARQSIVFLGCSYTFGHGINDEQTFAYLTGERLRDSYATYNFGFSGDGPNNFLNRIRDGDFERVVKQPPKLFILSTMQDHVRRVAGWRLDSYRNRDPMYKLDAQGKLFLAGRFSERGEAERRALWFSEILPIFYPGKKDLDLYTELLKATREEIARRYPDARFVVVYWPVPHKVGRAIHAHIEEALLGSGLEVHTSSEFLSGDPWQYVIDRDDIHPNALAHKRMADYVVDRLLSGLVG